MESAFLKIIKMRKTKGSREEMNEKVEIIKAGNRSKTTENEQ